MIQRINLGKYSYTDIREAFEFVRKFGGVIKYKVQQIYFEHHKSSLKSLGEYQKQIQR